MVLDHKQLAKYELCPLILAVISLELITNYPNTTFLEFYS